MKLHKNMTNVEISNLLKSISAAYKTKDEKKNHFKVVAYDRAASAVQHLSSEIKDIWDDNKLTDIPGIGPSIADHLGEIFKTGKSKHFNKVLKGLPEEMFELIKVSGIGTKRAHDLVTKQGIKGHDPIKKLEKLAKTKKIKHLPNISKSIAEHKTRKNRLLLSKAENISDEIINFMKKNKNIIQIEVLGSLRRKTSTVGDIDIAASTNSPAEILNYFTSFPKKSRILESGKHTASIILPGNIQVDLMVTSPGSFGSLLQHFTGSKHHNIALRERAMKKNLSLSEYGIKKNKKLTKYKDEKSFYAALGLPLIPPELREDRGELESKIPTLVDLKDIKGDLHIHSNFNIETSHDIGEHSMEEIINKAIKLSYKYIAFSEHNPSQSKHNQKQITDLLKRKLKKIKKLNKKYKNLKIFNSLEIDILPDGSLPVADVGLKFLDFALVSIHSSFRLSREKMTDRVLKALSHPKIKIFAHPTARKLNHREGVDLNWEKIFSFCKSHKKILEINSSPQRLDLPDHLVFEAIKKGVKLSINTDTHHLDHMDFMNYGVSVARRGWVKPSNIINTLSLLEITKVLK